MNLYELFNPEDFPSPGENLTNLDDQNDTVHSKNASKIIDFIHTHCSDSLQAMLNTHQWLFRGLKTHSSNLFLGNPRTDRRPADLSPAMQLMFDTALTKMGFNALRSNSVFTSAKRTQAVYYGQVFNIFPFNGFHFTSSSSVDDLFGYDWSYYSQKDIKFMGDLHEIYMSNLDNYKMSLATARRLVNMGSFFHDDFQKALKSNNEILITGNYLAVENSLFEKYLEKLL